jgi:hypothetical protein
MMTGLLLHSVYGRTGSHEDCAGFSEQLKATERQRPAEEKKGWKIRKDI